jgi:hypothetical protein
MTGSREDRLRVVAVSPGETYIGASFCGSEERWHGAFGRLDPLKRLAFVAARKRVQQGEGVDASMEGVVAPPKTEQYMRACLGSIAAGRCALFAKS